MRCIPSHCLRSCTLLTTAMRRRPNRMATGGAYDELTLWEQIDNGAQYTPAKKWLTSVPIGLSVSLAALPSTRSS